MPMNEEVRKAVSQNVSDAVSELQRKAFAFDAMVAAGRISKNLAEQSIALSDGPIESHQAATIHAELTRLTEIADAVDPLVVRLGEVTTRLEVANALLRKIRGCINETRGAYAGDVVREIDAHLSENGHD